MSDLSAAIYDFLNIRVAQCSSCDKEERMIAGFYLCSGCMFVEMLSFDKSRSTMHCQALTAKNERCKLEGLYHGFCIHHCFKALELELLQEINSSST
jgi:hypothetical protein